MISTSLCLADAQVLIDGVRYGFLQSVLDTYTIGVASSAFIEVSFFRDEQGGVHPIDLQPIVTTGVLTIRCTRWGTELQTLYAQGISTRLGAGELESLVLEFGRGLNFCTADRLAVKTMRALGCSDRWVSLEDLLASLTDPQKVPHPKYLRAATE